jgi:hypothetical protein
MFIIFFSVPKTSASLNWPCLFKPIIAQINQINTDGGISFNVSKDQMSPKFKVI